MENQPLEQTEFLAGPWFWLRRRPSTEARKAGPSKRVSPLNQPKALKGQPAAPGKPATKREARTSLDLPAKKRRKKRRTSKTMVFQDIPYTKNHGVFGRGGTRNTVTPPPTFAEPQRPPMAPPAAWRGYSAPLRRRASGCLDSGSQPAGSLAFLGFVGLFSLFFGAVSGRLGRCWLSCLAVFFCFLLLAFLAFLAF